MKSGEEANIVWCTSCIKQRERKKVSSPLVHLPDKLVDVVLPVALVSTLHVVPKVGGQSAKVLGRR